MGREAKAIEEMNAVAGLQGGFDRQHRRRGITLGYIGNVESGRDDRAWGFFRPHPDASKRMLGRFPTREAVLDYYNSHRYACLEWAQGAEKS